MNRPLVPGFLKRFDRKLLLNKPDIWSTRIHLLVFYSLVFCIAIAIYSFISMNDPRDNSQQEVPILFISLLSFIGFVVWLIYLLRFNVFKRFGEYKTGDGIKTFGLFFTGVLFLVVPAFIPAIIESWKANKAFTTREILQDINRMNELILLKHRNILPKDWSRQNILLVSDDDPRLLRNAGSPEPHTQDTAVAAVTVTTSSEIFYSIVDKEQLLSQIENADSSIKVTDSTYYIYNCPNLQFIQNYHFTNYGDTAVLNSMRLYKKLTRGKINGPSGGGDGELNNLLEKYTFSNYQYGYGLEPIEPTEYHRIIERRYQLGNVNASISNISQKKFRWDGDNLSVYLRLAFYISFSLAVLLFVFRHSTVKVFFLSVLTFIILMILNGLIISATSRRDSGIFGAMLFNYAVLFVAMLFLTRDTNRKSHTGVALNIVTVVTAFVPMVCVMYFYSSRRMLYDTRYYDIGYEQQTNHLLIAETGGILLFLVLLEPFFKRMYRRWYALPEN